MHILNAGGLVVADKGDASGVPTQNTCIGSALVALKLFTNNHMLYAQRVPVGLVKFVKGIGAADVFKYVFLESDCALPIKYWYMKYEPTNNIIPIAINATFAM